MTETTAVLKTDVLGRVRISREHREALLDAFENGGTSGLEFARSHGVNYQTFASWIQKRRRERDSYPVTAGGSNDLLALTLAEVELPREVPTSSVAIHEPAGSAVEIALNGGVVIRATDRTTLPFVVELVRALRSC